MTRPAPPPPARPETGCRAGASAQEISRRSACRLCAALVLLACTGAGAARAAAGALPPGFKRGEMVRPVEALDGDTLRLADGRRLRLAVIAAPKRPLDQSAAGLWPAGEAARAALAGLALNRDWFLVTAGTPRDRYGRLLGHLVDAEDNWLNLELVAAGQARVLSTPDVRLGVDRLLEAEGRARAERRGLWASFAYRVLPAEEARFGLNRFALVEGFAQAVATVRGRTYVNFGENWREDFTVSLEPADRRLFEREGVDPGGYQGRRLRVRGWVLAINGPLIEATHPEQIEVLA